MKHETSIKMNINISKTLSLATLKILFRPWMGVHISPTIQN